MTILNLRKSLAAISLSTALTAAAFSAAPLGFVSQAQADPVYVSTVQQPGFADVVEKVKPAVVSVQVKSDLQRPRELGGVFSGPGFDQLPDNHPLKRFFRDFENRRGQKAPNHHRGRPRPVSQGSGFFISEDGYVVTNNHVVSDGTAFSVVLDDGTELDAKLVGTDPRTDVAVLKVTSERKFTYVNFADDNKVRIGDWVVAVGNPFGLGGTVTAGIVSARGRDIGAGVYDDFIQIDAAVNRGNSGGPTFNLNGQVVGINTAIFSPSGGNVGIAFAIPATTAKDVVSQLVENGAVKRGWIGVQIQPVTRQIADSIGMKDAKGALIADPMDGPAAKAGIKAGDAIISVNGQEVADARDLARKVAAIAPGKTATLGVWRNGKQEDIKITIAAMPKDQNTLGQSGPAAGGEEANITQFGFTVVPSEDGTGLVITDVDPDGDAAENGIRPGDVILSVNNQPVSNVATMNDIIKKAIDGGRGSILVQVSNNDLTRFIALSLRAE